MLAIPRKNSKIPGKIPSKIPSKLERKAAFS